MAGIDLTILLSSHSGFLIPSASAHSIDILLKMAQGYKRKGGGGAYLIAGTPDVYLFEAHDFIHYKINKQGSSLMTLINVNCFWLDWTPI